MDSTARENIMNNWIFSQHNKIEQNELKLGQDFRIFL